MSDVRVASIILEHPDHHLLTIDPNGTASVYWFGEPDKEQKNEAYKDYADALKNVAEGILGWTEGDDED